MRMGRFMFVVGSGEEEPFGSDIQLLRLKHPSTGKDALYGIQKDAKRLFELQKDKQDTKLKPLSNILHVPNYPDFRHLNGVFSSAMLEKICEVNDKYGDDMILVKVIEEKVVDWLVRKVEHVGSYFQKQLNTLKYDNGSLRSSAATATGFNLGGITKRAEAPKQSPSTSSIDKAVERDATILALGFVSEYVHSSWMEKLCGKFDTTLIEIMGKKKNSTNEQKKRKWDDKIEGTGDNYHNYMNQPIKSADGKVLTKQKDKTERMSIAQKSLLKVDKKGMRSMMSFFKPMPKKK